MGCLLVVSLATPVLQAPVQLIQHSDLFAARFAQNTQLSATTSPMKDLRAAMHRYESQQKPTGRGAWHSVANSSFLPLNHHAAAFMNGMVSYLIFLR